MRLFAVWIVLVSLTAPTVAQEQGSVVVDAMTTRGRHFGMGYYLTDRLSVRPSLGINRSEQFGTTFNFGADSRFELLPGRRVSPYLTAGFNFLHDSSLTRYDATSSTFAETSNLMRYGGGLGVRARVKYGLCVVGEGRVMNSELRDAAKGPMYGQTVESGAHFEVAVGVSYTLR